MHPNAQTIERLYSSLQAGKADAAADCYSRGAGVSFQDIAFRLESWEAIHDMWRMVCAVKPAVKVTFDSIVADETKGSAHWVADYMYGAKDDHPGRRVVNSTSAEFEFREDRIFRHVDDANALAWAAQAYPLPISLGVGLIGPMRRFFASVKLHKFRKDQMNGLA